MPDGSHDSVWRLACWCDLNGTPSWHETRGGRGRSAKGSRCWDATWVVFAKVAAAGHPASGVLDSDQGSQLEWSFAELRSEVLCPLPPAGAAPSPQIPAARVGWWVITNPSLA